MNVDVLVCAKNRAKSMNRVLQQIVREVPFKNLIVVYGSSMDETEEIAKRFTDKVFWDGDKGLGAARNLGVRKATSEIVAMIDTDIILTKGWHRQLIRHFADPKVAAVMGTCVYGYGCSPLERLWEYKRWRDLVNWGCHNTMFRRDTVLEVGNFDETIQGAGEDYDLYLKLLDAGYIWKWVREATVYHPMNMREYLNHVRWWAEGKPYVCEALRYAIDKSMSWVVYNYLFSSPKSTRWNLILSVFIHPTLLLYLPLLRMTRLRAGLKGLKKILKNGALLAQPQSL